MPTLDNVWYVDDPQYGVVPLGANNSTFGATVVLTPVTVPSGALIVVAVSESSAVSGTLSDGGTNTYGKTSNSPISWNAASEVVNIFFIANAAALSGATFTYTKGTSGVNASIAAMYVPNIASASAEDTAVANSATGNSASASVTSNTPAQNADLLVGVVSENANGLPGSATGWNTIAQSGVALVGITLYAGGVRGGLAPSALTASVVSGQWVASVVGFKYASAPGGYSGVNGWQASHTQICGDIIRPSDLSHVAVNNERVFVCISSTGGTGQTAASEPTLTATRGAKTTDNTVTWQEATGVAALNGDLTNTPTWAQMKAASTTATLGQVIQSGDGTKILICTVSGTVGGSEPSPWATYTTTGATTVDNGATWVTLAAVPSGFANWGAPHARLNNACGTSGWGVAGNAFYVASEHYELQSSPIGIGFFGTTANPNFVYCVNKSNVPPGSANLTTGASLNTIGANGISWTSGSGQLAYVYGITSSAGSLASAANIQLVTAQNSALVCKSCSFTLNSTGGSIFRLGNTTSSGGQKLRTESCTWTFGNTTGQNFQSGAAGELDCQIIGGSVVVGANIPTTLFATLPSTLLLQGVDLSAIPSGKTLIGASNLSGITIIQDCKLASGVTIAATPTVLSQNTYLIRSDSSGTNYRHEKYHYTGTQTVETTIVRTGGASDGTTSLSHKIVTTANSKWVLPFESIPIPDWADTAASHTVTVYGTTTTGGVPNDDEIWIEIEYLGSGANPQGSILTTTKSNNLAASSAVNNSSDGSTWGGAGAGNGFKIVSPAFVTGQKGDINVTVKAAKATATYYIDPKLVVS